MAGATATATSVARDTLIRSKGTKIRTPCTRITPKGSFVTTASQQAPGAGPEGVDHGEARTSPEEAGGDHPSSGGTGHCRGGEPGDGGGYGV